MRHGAPDGPTHSADEIRAASTAAEVLGDGVTGRNLLRADSSTVETTPKFCTRWGPVLVEQEEILVG